MQRRHFLSWCSGVTAGALLGMPEWSHAQLTIEISGSGSRRIPIAVANFEGEAALPASLTEVVRADLERSGLFVLIGPGSQAVGDNANVDWSAWRNRSTDALVGASVARTSDNRFEVRTRLYDVVRQNAIAFPSLLFTADSLRKAGHKIADFIYQQLLGERGIFDTRICYVEKTGNRYALQVADSDGRNPQSALFSREPIISPTWSPDGTRIAYVAFEARKPIIYVRELASDRRPVLANFKGSNSAPAWAPDGRRLAVVLTRDGPSQLYLINPDGSGLRRLSQSSAIDTEPCFAPDGRSIYFTSDRGGAPQIYRMPVDGGEAQRVTFDGGYNVSPRISPDGRNLAYISRNNGRFQVSVMDLSSRQTQVLTDTAKDESPSFSPNGRFILYATESGGRDVLAVVSIDGKTKYRLTQTASDIREPAWGPYQPS